MTGVAVALAAAVGLAAAVASPASAATQEQLSNTIQSGLKQKVADDVILSGDSTWNTPSGEGSKKNRFLDAFAAGLKSPNQAPPGANNWSCKSSQEPVVLVHGTWENAYNNFAYLSYYLKKAGFCVYALNYGILPLKSGGGVGAALPGTYGTGDISQSAGQLAQFVDKVRASSGAAKVNLVGHSQGGLMARQYLKFNGGAGKVDRLVTLGATNHGTSLDGIGTLGRTINNAGIDILGPIALGVGVSGIQQVYDSQFLKTLNADGDTVAGVKYTVIGTKYDEVTTPYASTFLKGDDVTNVTLQDGCGIDVSDHLSMTYSPRAASIVLNSLGAKYLGVRVPVICGANAWFFG